MQYYQHPLCLEIMKYPFFNKLFFIMWSNMEEHKTSSKITPRLTTCIVQLQRNEEIVLHALKYGQDSIIYIQKVIHYFAADEDFLKKIFIVAPWDAF